MKHAYLSGVLLAVISGMAQGAVSLSGTRLIFDGRYNEATIEVSNRSNAETLIQAWLDAPREDDQPGDTRAADLPFALTPHLVRMPAMGKQTLRLLYEGIGMSLERESMLHLYVLEIPRRSPAVQQLSIAIRQRINVFYRPAGLAGNPADAAQALIWQRAQSANATLSVRNPTPYHVSLQDLRINGIEVAEYRLLAPFSDASLTLPVLGTKRSVPEALSFKAMTDYGGQREHCAPFQGGQPFNVPLRTPDSHSLIGKC
ncbi:molecular chaperone [Pseudomonas sp. P2498]|uniref:Molecular chaperone n=2 Tax=Pseudomonas petrae TaxID=2912190 RepID=A0ABS9I3W7_9PSED|nr:molecular chaperone [Pseudomonas petrae]MCF7531236.1 molecular chaperone [Pseudomonas petrae]MCF7540074.1 molecular chaperone [Pseudomonas petrae]MCF7542039.1 molecular chaperone [Pseudomonas petrae]MCF7554606.1 molecular chaperone [Pseudomonas petrae]